MTDGVFTRAGIDALPPPEMARKAEDVGVAKAAMPAATTLALSVPVAQVADGAAGIRSCRRARNTREQRRAGPREM